MTSYIYACSILVRFARRPQSITTRSLAAAEGCATTPIHLRPAHAPPHTSSYLPARSPTRALARLQTRTMDAVAREKAVYLAKLAEQAERYDGMCHPRCALRPAAPSFSSASYPRERAANASALAILSARLRRRFYSVLSASGIRFEVLRMRNRGDRNVPYVSLAESISRDVGVEASPSLLLHGLHSMSK